MKMLVTVCVFLLLCSGFHAASLRDLDLYDDLVVALNKDLNETPRSGEFFSLCSKLQNYRQVILCPKVIGSCYATPYVILYLWKR